MESDEFVDAHTVPRDEEKVLAAVVVSHDDCKVPSEVIVEKEKEEEEQQVESKEVDEDEEEEDEDEGEIYEVGSILEERTEGGVQEYLVRWKGYGSDYDSWEPVHNLNCDDIIEEFERQKKKRRGIAAKRRRDPEPEEDEEDYEPPSPPPKKRAKRGTGGGGRGKKRKPTGRVRRWASNKEPIVVRCKTIFKKHIIQNCLKCEDRRDDSDDSSPDMITKYFMKYDIDSGELLVGNIRVDVDEVEKLLKCSACDKTFGNMGVWRMVREMKLHVIGHHLGGFTCYLCNEPYSFHTKGANHFYNHMGKFHPRDGKPGRKQGRNRKFDDEEETSLDDTVCGGDGESVEDGSQVSNDGGGTEDAITPADPTKI